VKPIELTEISCLILSTMSAPTHGYEIMKSVEADLEGRVSVGPATLYTNLSKLVDAGLCVFTEVANKKVYEITTLGKTVLDQEVEKRRRILAFMENQMEKALEKGVNL